MSIPTDPIILLSYINTKLRDEFPSLTELCKTLHLDEQEICSKLRKTGYEYNQEHNKFI